MINKFYFAQLTSNTNGKTSGSALMGVVISFCGCFGFVWGVVLRSGEIMGYSFGVIGVGAGLLGLRRFTANKEQSKIDEP